jgi:hypothetical protein
MQRLPRRYWQCLPGGGAPAEPPSSPSPPPVEKTIIAYLLQQYGLPPGITCADVDADAFTATTRDVLQGVGSLLEQSNAH